MNLLINLYKIHSMSGKEQVMRDFIRKHVSSMDKSIKIAEDHKGNLYLTKGKSETYPCLAAHMDQVQTTHSDDFDVYRMKGDPDRLFGYSKVNNRQEGLGADDKNGIWVALKCLASEPVLKVAFFVEEEVGCRGSSAADISFFKDCRFVAQIDRKNGGDLITDIYDDMCSEDFLKDADYKKYGYEPCDGLTTDVATLRERGLKVSCINMSCGYYNPHSDTEYTNFSELKNCLTFVRNIIRNCTKTYPHESVRSRWNCYGSSHYGLGHRYFGSSVSALDYFDLAAYLHDVAVNEGIEDESTLYYETYEVLDALGVSEDYFMQVAYGVLYDIYCEEEDCEEQYACAH